jgi:rubrerythrin
MDDDQIVGTDFQPPKTPGSLVVFIAVEGFQNCVDTVSDKFTRIVDAEHMRFFDALGKLGKGDSGELKPFYVCQYCGNTVEGEAPEKCPVCGAPKKMFKLIE